MPRKTNIGRVAVVVIVLALTFGVTDITEAVQIPFGDSHNYWPGWENNTSDDFKDTIGIPDLLGGRIEINSDGKLERLEFDYEASSLSLWRLVFVGDLFFISTGPDNNWDYLVRLDENNMEGDYPLFPVDIPLDSSSYLLSDPSHFPGCNIRQNHPYGYDISGDAPLVYFDGLDKPEPAGTMYSTYFDFGDNAIPIDGRVTIGWTLTCANDVIYESVPVPEPATLFLLGSGLIGLVAFRKKLRKS